MVLDTLVLKVPKAVPDSSAGCQSSPTSRRLPLATSVAGCGPHDRYYHDDGDQAIIHYGTSVHI